MNWFSSFIIHCVQFCTIKEQHVHYFASCIVYIFISIFLAPIMQWGRTMTVNFIQLCIIFQQFIKATQRTICYKETIFTVQCLLLVHRFLFEERDFTVYFYLFIYCKYLLDVYPYLIVSFYVESLENQPLG